MTRVIFFVFAGRRQNMDLQLPMVRRVLAEHPNVEFHIPNLARTRIDAIYVRRLGGERMVVRQEFYRKRFQHVYQHYMTPEYEGCLFVKIDDDVVFLETQKFSEFLAAVESNPGSVISADIVNNGCCSRLHPELFAQFEELGIPLLDWHLNRRTAGLAHDYFFANVDALLGRPVGLVPTKDWLSINLIGFGWDTMRVLGERVGTKSPRWIAGREFRSGTLGDEGVVNMLPRKILRGFTACHLSFGPQRCSVPQLEGWREQYRRIGRNYLAGGELVGVVEQAG